MQRDILLIHGWWAADWVWSRMAGQLDGSGFRTHAVTLPGPESTRHGFLDHLDHALAAARSIGNPILVGHSVGGLIAMKMSTVLDPPACIAITPAAPAGVLPRPNMLLVRFLFEAMPSLLLGRPFLPRDLLRRIDLNLLPPAEQDEVLAKMRPVSAAQVRKIMPAFVRVDPRKLHAPLLVIGAGRDRLTPPAQTRAIARRYDADYREYPDAAHYILREAGWSAMTTDVVSWIEAMAGARVPEPEAEARQATAPIELHARG